MRTKVKTSFLNAGSIFQTGGASPSVGRSRAVRMSRSSRDSRYRRCAKLRPVARSNAPTTARHRRERLMTSVRIAGSLAGQLGLEEAAAARRDESFPAAAYGRRGSGVLPPALAKPGVWPRRRRPDEANAPFGNGHQL